MKYSPQEPPADVKSIPEYLSGELRRLETTVRFPIGDAISATASASYGGVIVKSQPPAGAFRVLNFYMNADRELVVVYG